MWDKRLIVFALILVVLLAGCHKENISEEITETNSDAVFIGGLHTIANEVFYSSNGAIYRMSDPAEPLFDYEGSACYSETQEKYYILSDGVIIVFDPITEETSIICSIDIEDVYIKCVTENYVLLGKNGSFYALNLTDNSTQSIEDVFPYSADILTTDGDTAYFRDYNEEILYSYSFVSREKTPVYGSADGGNHSVIKALVCGNDVYVIESSGYMYRIFGLKGGEMSEPELVDGAFGTGEVIDVAECNDGILFVSCTQNQVITLWQLPDGGEAEKLASWKDVNYYLKGSGELAVSDSIVACCVTTDEKCRIFTYDLEAQKDEVYYAN